MDDRRQRDFSAIHRARLRAAARTGFIQREIPFARSAGNCGVRRGHVAFFVGKLRPQDIDGNLAALASGVLCLLFSVAASSEIAARQQSVVSDLWKSLLALVCSYAGVKALPKMSAQDAGIVLFLGVVQIGLAYTFLLSA
jgi:hypothetical protein